MTYYFTDSKTSEWIDVFNKKVYLEGWYRNKGEKWEKRIDNNNSPKETGYRKEKNQQEYANLERSLRKSEQSRVMSRKEFMLLVM